MDKYDELQDQFCSFLSTISKTPRKKCDEMMTVVDHGLKHVSEMQVFLDVNYGHDNVAKVRAIMTMLGNEGVGERQVRYSYESGW